jgi:hypothetical protein
VSQLPCLPKRDLWIHIVGNGKHAEQIKGREQTSTSAKSPFGGEVDKDLAEGERRNQGEERCGSRVDLL